MFSSPRRAPIIVIYSGPSRATYSFGFGPVRYSLILLNVILFSILATNTHKYTGSCRRKDCPVIVNMICYVSLGNHTEKYQTVSDKLCNRLECFSHHLPLLPPLSAETEMLCTHSPFTISYRGCFSVGNTILQMCIFK